MEPGNATAVVTPGRVDVWTGDQSPDRARLRAAQAAGALNAWPTKFKMTVFA